MPPTEYKYVPSEGPLDARTVILAESPWINEVHSQRPLAGQSGNLLKRWWFPMGLMRSEMRLMNLFPWRPPTREITSVPTEKLVPAIEGIHRRIAKLTNPHVIVTMGNYATYALTGKGNIRADVRKPFDAFYVNATTAEKKAGITQLRGSIYTYTDLNGRRIKVIPTIHPAAVLQMPKWEKRSIVDWERVKREAQFAGVQEPHKNYVINPNRMQIEEYCHRVAVGGSEMRLAVDVETWGRQLTCVGFAHSPWESFTIPTWGRHEENLPYVKFICESQAQKVLCNGNYDHYWLDEYKINLVNYLWDVQSMHHALDPAENHSLNYLASLYCPYYQYWKDEAKEAEEIVKYAKDMDSLYVYNGMDCCYTRELVDILEAELQREGMLPFYFQCYQQMFEPLLRTMRYGIRVDVERQKAVAKQLRAEMKELHAELNLLAGCELFATEERTAFREPTEAEYRKLLTGKELGNLNRRLGAEGKFMEPPDPKEIDREARIKLKDHGLVYMINGDHAGQIRYKKIKLKKDFSNAKLLEFFYGTLGLKKQYKLRKGKKGKTRSESLDEDSLRKLMQKYPKAVKAGQLLLRYREKKKELDYLRGAWDKDGRIRCSYTMTTNAGRLASSGNPMGRGYNLQNLKR